MALAGHPWSPGSIYRFTRDASATPHRCSNLCPGSGATGPRTSPSLKIGSYRMRWPTPVRMVCVAGRQLQTHSGAAPATRTHHPMRVTQSFTTRGARPSRGHNRCVQVSRGTSVPAIRPPCHIRLFYRPIGNRPSQTAVADYLASDRPSPFAARANPSPRSERRHRAGASSTDSTSARSNTPRHTNLDVAAAALQPDVIAGPGLSHDEPAGLPIPARNAPQLRRQSPRHTSGFTWNNPHGPSHSRPMNRHRVPIHAAIESRPRRCHGAGENSAAKPANLQLAPPSVCSTGHARRRPLRPMSRTPQRRRSNLAEPNAAAQASRSRHSELLSPVSSPARQSLIPPRDRGRPLRCGSPPPPTSGGRTSLTRPRPWLAGP